MEQAAAHDSPSGARYLRLILVAVVLAYISTSPAMAQSDSDDSAKARAKALFKQGKTQYDLGNFEEAIDVFKRAYRLSPYPNLLYNIAQAYRQMGDCQALFFYKRYLSIAGKKARNRTLVESRINELNQTCQAMEDLKEKPPPGAMSPDENSGDYDTAVADSSVEVGGDDADSPNNWGTVVADAAGQSSQKRGENLVENRDVRGKNPDDAQLGVNETKAIEGSYLVSSVEFGPAFLDIGELDIGGQYLTVGLGVAYPLSLGRAGVDIGGLFTYTPIDWSNNQEMSGTVGMWGALFHVGARYWVLDKLAVRGHLGVGIMVLTDLDEGNVFLNTGDRVDGAGITMFNVRVSVGLDYLVTDNIMLTASPFAFSHSPVKADLRDGIEAFNRIEITAGLGYRL
ncbi:MAG: tetratricopeptide repeat protein [Proteobacteria bacterium]|nr:tetratricopeptide repeat protein [Pseudomonadota bacterium]